MEERGGEEKKRKERREKREKKKNKKLTTVGFELMQVSLRG